MIKFSFAPKGKEWVESLNTRMTFFIERIENFNCFILLYEVVSVFCLSRTISLTAEPILFSFKVKLLIGSEKVLNYFWRGCIHPPLPQKYLFTLRNSNLKLDEVDFPPPTLSAARGF